MRTIKFKGKSVDSGEWIEGYYYKECDNTYIIEDRQKKKSMLNRNEAVLIDPSIVCQFTGFQDMAGTDIYEGDIVVSPVYPFCLYSQANDKFNPDYVGIVSWNEYLACFELRMRKNYSIPGRDVYSNKLRAFNKTWLLEYEVIGSIHDPEWQQKLNLKTE